MSADPIDQYLQADVPLRVLLEHGAERLDWLTSLEVSPIVLSYRDASGEIVNEHVTKLGLVERAHALGWTPWEPGAAEKIVFEESYVWLDEVTEQGAVGGIWFSHEHAMHWEGDAWGTPLGIPAERFAAIERREIAKREESQRVRADIAERELLLPLAKRVHEYIEGRVRGCRERHGVEVSHSDAWEQVLAIAAIHGVDLFDETKGQPLPWSDEYKQLLRQQLREYLLFCADVDDGVPVSECKPTP